MKYLIIVILIFSSCAKKYLYITSEPIGALIEINNITMGRAPTTPWVKINPYSLNSWKIQAIPSYDLNTMVTAFLDAAEMTGYTREQAAKMAEIYFAKYERTQYTQSKLFWSDDLMQFKGDTLRIHFDMFLEPVPEKYEIEWK